MTLTDEEIRPDAIGIFRQSYPYTVRLDYDNSHTREPENSIIDTGAGDKTFEELVKEFYAAMYGNEITDDEMKVMEEVAREAGVINEAG